MSVLKYKVITSQKQYDQYCKKSEELILQFQHIQEEVALLSLLMEKYKGHDPFQGMDPVEVLMALMQQLDLKQADLVRNLKISSGVISDITNYRKGFSKNLIRQLSSFFNISQEVFNKPYKFNAARKKKLKSKRKVLKLQNLNICEAV
ncbi:MAG TPA: hypothetical protein VMY77_15325 [Chitinophagaceae bacterium]|nr:hypothetical protein [Chitinophagaceae bacterium]